ncbi:MAG TPA: hypothetical protein VIL97_08905, partial [Thermoanaerobaculia bacterium]
ETQRDDLQSKARSVEEIVLTPTLRHIEVRRLHIIWAPGWEKESDRKRTRPATSRPRALRRKTEE